MAAEIIDYQALLKGLPPGAWVAISEREHRVIAYDAELRPTVEKAKNLGEEHPLIIRVPEQAVSLFL